MNAQINVTVNAPEWVRYVAVDKNGRIYGYSKQPTTVPVIGRWVAEGAEVAILGRFQTEARKDLHDWDVCMWPVDDVQIPPLPPTAPCSRCVGPSTGRASHETDPYSPRRPHPSHAGREAMTQPVTLEKVAKTLDDTIAAFRRRNMGVFDWPEQAALIRAAQAVVDAAEACLNEYRSGYNLGPTLMGNLDATIAAFDAISKGEKP